jgi:hypothetical protein
MSMRERRSRSFARLLDLARGVRQRGFDPDRSWRWHDAVDFRCVVTGFHRRADESGYVFPCPPRPSSVASFLTSSPPTR